VPSRVVVLVSGEGSNLQALLDAATEPDYGVEVVGVVADREGITGLARAELAEVPTSVVRLSDCADRAVFNQRTADAIAAFEPDLVVLAGYMKILAPEVVERWTMVNTHPALLPAFPGAHAVRDALAHGVKLAGVTVHLVVAEVDAGPIVAQTAVEVRPDDDEATLHARIKQVERSLLVDSVGRLARSGYRLEGRKVVLL
jgi:formyltetrahydrofolate-dependent phosphoribosylglycinamide formyltransferase